MIEPKQKELRSSRGRFCLFVCCILDRLYDKLTAAVLQAISWYSFPWAVRGRVLFPEESQLRQSRVVIMIMMMMRMMMTKTVNVCVCVCASCQSKVAGLH